MCTPYLELWNGYKIDVFSSKTTPKNLDTDLDLKFWTGNRTAVDVWDCFGRENPML